jgi:predicted dienelactone hydrolase
MHARTFAAVCSALLALAPAAGAIERTTPCLRVSGNAGARCLDDYLVTVQRCRAVPDAACETAARAPGGALEAVLAAPEAPSLARCSEATADMLGYVGLVDLVARVPEACTDFAEDLLALAWADDLAALTPEALACQRLVADQLRRLTRQVIRAFGPRCYVRAAGGGRCGRAIRDARVARARTLVARRLVGRCGDDFDALGLAEGATLAARVDDLLARVVDRARHFAQRVYPPNDLGPTAEFGPFPIGVRTLALADPARLNVAGTGPRPVVVEVYYPSTEAAVAGVPEDVVQVLGLDIVATPAFRDVDRAPGTFPLVLFSHGNNGVRFQSFFFAAHLASHGYVVATPDHHGNTFVDTLLGIVDAASAVNRPRDLSFLLDRFAAFTVQPGHVFEGAIDVARIGVSGHSFGGYTTFALAGGPFALGTFTDARVQAIFPQAPAAFAFDDAFFATITVPTLIVGGSIDETTPFAADQQRPFDHLPAGAAVVGLAQLIGGGHFTFSDFCEVPRNLLAFLGGFDEACEPRHLPWRHAHDRVNFLALAFFDAVLRGDAAALARLDPARLAEVEDMAYTAK